jgi:hypothetical protein
VRWRARAGRGHLGEAHGDGGDKEVEEEEAEEEDHEEVVEDGAAAIALLRGVHSGGPGLTRGASNRRREAGAEVRPPMYHGLNPRGLEGWGEGGIRGPSSVVAPEMSI